MAQQTFISRARTSQKVWKPRGRWSREDHIRHRDYSPTIGRFIERDPLGFEAGDNNWYRFVANGPTGKTDSSGLFEREKLPTNGNECKYEPNKWNDPTGDTKPDPHHCQYRNNCYSYACNDDDPIRRPGTKPQPGDKSKVLPTNAAGRVTCESVTKASLADGLAVIDCGAPCPARSYKVALVVSPGNALGAGNDYHWYRQNPDGTWSHKPGLLAVSNKDSGGEIIVDPRTANRNPPGPVNYTEFCGCFCVKAKP